jgi:hypothetical protein
MGRVHRLGQANETWVHRYIVREAIEEGVYALAEKRRRQLNSSDDEAQVNPIKKANASGEIVNDSDVNFLIQSELGVTFRSGQTEPGSQRNAQPVLEERQVMRTQALVAAEGRRLTQQTALSDDDDSPEDTNEQPGVARRGARKRRRDIIQ